MKRILIILATTAVAGCNTTPEQTVSTGVIAPVTFDTAIHDDLSCGQLAEERLWVSSVLYKDETAETVGSQDAVNVLSYDADVLELTDKDISQLKGYLLAIDGSMLTKQCKTS